MIAASNITLTIAERHQEASPLGAQQWVRVPANVTHPDLFYAAFSGVITILVCETSETGL